MQKYFRPRLSQRLYQSMRVYHFLAIATAILLTALFKQYTDSPILLYWLSYMVIVNLGLIILGYGYGRILPEDKAWSWTRCYTLLHTLACLGWGASAIILFSPLAPWQEFTLALLLANVAVASFIPQTQFKPLPYITVGGILVPTLVCLLVEQDSLREDLLFSLILAVFCIDILKRASETSNKLLRSEDEAAELENVRRVFTNINHESPDRIDSLTGLPHYDHFIQRLEDSNASGQCPYAVIALGIKNYDALSLAYSPKGFKELLIMLSRRLCDLNGGKVWVAKEVTDEFLIGFECRNPRLLQGVLNEIQGIARDASESMVQYGGFEFTHGHMLYEGEETRLLSDVEDAIFTMRTQKSRDAGTQALNSQTRQNFQRLSMLRSELKGALARGELSLHVQPKISVSNRNNCSGEALLRWNSPKLGAVPPDEFIPIAEHLHLIEEIGEWVLQQGVAILNANELSGPYSLAVNVSIEQLKNPDFHQSVAAHLAAIRRKDRQLEIEVTESIDINEPENVVHNLARIRELGIRVSLDDFGVGYSSLSYLTTLPIDVLKLDRYFIADVPGNPKSENLVESVIALAQNLGLKIVAEGVEDEHQIAWLEEHGCDYIQGYYYSKPLSLDDFFIWQASGMGVRRQA